MWPLSRMATVFALTMMAFLTITTSGLDIHEVRQLAARNNVTCVLVFGDSSVDPGNNNRLATDMKGNFLPYGKDFFNGRPTGRFSDGRLPTDFIAEAIGYTKAIPAFLDPTLKPSDLLHGVSFASAGSGYDELTANLSNVLSIPKQLKYFEHYKLHLSKQVGWKKANFIIRNAIFIISMGTNDFLQNYFLEPDRAKQYTIDGYQNLLVSRMLQGIQEMRRHGATRLVVVGVPPLGCMPLVKTLMGSDNACVEGHNRAAATFNAKIKDKLLNAPAGGGGLGLKAAFVDCYQVIQKAINSPKQYGFEETQKGCCGSGIIEYGNTCKGMTTCSDPYKYAFWDAVHPTEKMYRIIADEAIRAVKAQILQ